MVDAPAVHRDAPDVTVPCRQVQALADAGDDRRYVPLDGLAHLLGPDREPVELTELKALAVERTEHDPPRARPEIGGDHLHHRRLHRHPRRAPQKASPDGSGPSGTSRASGTWKPLAL